MNDSPNRITTINKVEVYKNKFCTLRDDDVQFPSGNTGRYIRFSWVPPFSVGILPFNDKGELILVNVFRYATQKSFIEIPKGFGSNSITKEESALKELNEETGYTPRTLEFLTTINVDPGLIANPFHLFVGYDCFCSSDIALEDTESHGEIIRIRPEKFIEKIHHGEIDDAITQLAFLFWYTKKNRSPI